MFKFRGAFKAYYLVIPLCGLTFFYDPLVAIALAGICGILIMIAAVINGDIK